MNYNRYKKKCAELYSRVEGRCQNCGRYIWEPKKINFAHIESKMRMTESEKETNFLFICASLHISEHDAPPELENDYCVRIFRKKYGNPKNYFCEFARDVYGK